MGLIPGNSKSLWQSVNQARDMNHDEMPDKMYLNGNEIMFKTQSGKKYPTK